MQATSRDWLNLIITASPVPDFAAQSVEVSLSPDQFNPTTDWFPADHTADGLRLMIGPGTGPGQLQPGSWHAWGRLPALVDGTLPVFYIGAFLIEGGSDLAPMPPTTIGQAALDAAIAAEAAARTAGDAAERAYAKGLVRPPFLPPDCGAMTLDSRNTTVADTVPPSGTFYAMGVQWYGDNTVPLAVRYVSGVAGSGVTLFKMTIHDSAGVLRYSTANEAADANAAAGTRTLALLPVGAPVSFAYGELLSVGLIGVGGTNPSIPRFAALSAVLANLGVPAPMRPAVQNAALSDAPSTLANAISNSTFYYIQVLD